ncbi:MAG: hypothetical protein BIFFINMI_01442 [Phycisphaerae bacterium]|nr:hypothetical protein [Phycisphaerae bacterium]
MKTWTLAALCLLSAICPAVRADDAPAPGGTVILNQDSRLRAFMVFRTPVVMQADGKLRTALEPMAKEPTPIPDFQSTLPPADWFKPEFDDSAWDRQTAPVELPPGGATGRSHAARHTATVNSMICLRAKVQVDDPARATGLKLSVEYVGGVVVHLNGREIARGNMPAGPVAPDTLADKYPDDLYCLPDGMFLQTDANGQLKDDAAFERRYRRLEIAVPADQLRKGGNVLALEIHRAPINEGAVKARREPVGGMYVVPGIWAYAGLKELRLTSAAGQGVQANISRPRGIQVWNVAPFETVDVFDYGDPGEELRPITINSPRNGVFSGRLAVSSDQAIDGLKVTVSDLKPAAGSGAAIPASAVQVRYARPALPKNCWTPEHRFNGLVDEIPAQIPVSKAPLPRGARKTLSAGAVASLWFTLRTPRDAQAGAYNGTVTVQAAGLPPVQAPLRVNVSGWTLPDPKDFRQHHLIFLSQEAVAKHYGVPLWSDRHFELMANSLKLLAEVNSHEVPINLGTDFYGLMGNSETMIRWIRKGDGSYDYDFSVFDKYLDLVARCAGKPMPLRLNCWGEVGRDGKNAQAKFVSLLDPATGKIEDLEQPTFGTEESYKFWKPVVDATLKRLADRGWLDAASFGHNSYCYPVKPEIVDIAYRLWPEGVWSYTAHNGTLGGRFGGTKKETSMPIKTSVCVWTEGRLSQRGYKALLGPRPSLWCDTARTRHRDFSPLNVIHNLPEEVVMRGMDGVGDFGGDLFPVENASRPGRYYCLGNGRGTGGPNDAQRAILAPGDNGAISTERFEEFREGTEIAEAVLFLQNALNQKKMSDELAGKVNAFLEQRGQTFIRDWYDRGYAYINRWSIAGQFAADAELLDLAAQVAAQAK